MTEVEVGKLNIDLSHTLNGNFMENSYIIEESAIEEDFDIYDSETVECLICGAKLSQLSRHLKFAHNVNVQNYRNKYNNAKIVSEVVAKKRKESVCKSWEDADERRMKFSVFLKDSNPMHNIESHKKVCAEKDVFHLIEGLERDKEIKKQVEESGWTYEVVWSHEIDSLYVKSTKFKGEVYPL